MVDLYGKSLHQRAKLLISIAHPDFRAELTHQASTLNYL
jgi:acyl-CoA hydrolase